MIDKGSNENNEKWSEKVSNLDSQRKCAEPMRSKLKPKEKQEDETTIPGNDNFM